MSRKKEEETEVYKKPNRGFSKRTNTIVTVAFVIFVLVCCIIRMFV